MVLAPKLKEIRFYIQNTLITNNFDLTAQYIILMQTATKNDFEFCIYSITNTSFSNMIT